MENKTNHSGYIVVLRYNTSICDGFENTLEGVDELTAPTMALIAYADNPREFCETANRYSLMPLELFGCARCDEETFNKLIEELGIAHSHGSWYAPCGLFWRQLYTELTLKEAYVKALNLILDLDIQAINKLK